MNTAAVAVLVVLIASVGLYIGVLNLASQYSVGESSSSAGQVACAPAPTSVTRGQAVRWLAAGIPAGAVYHWSSDQGRTEVTPDGNFSATYSSVGQKTAHLFWMSGTRWFETSCTITVK